MTKKQFRQNHPVLQRPVRVIRTIYWSNDASQAAPIAIAIALPMRVTLWFCIAGMHYLGLFPDAVLGIVEQAVKSLRV